MGIDPHATRFLLAAQATGANFERTLTIGRQQLYMDSRSLRRAFQLQGIELGYGEAAGLLTGDDGFAESLLERLGAREVTSLDVSRYESADLVHDMNEPIPASLRAKYTVVLDGGSLEHIFDFPTAIRNCMQLTEVGGHLLLISPASGEAGHGFYQFSPELFYRVLSRENGFAVEQMLVKDGRWRSPWYAVTDPLRVKERVTLRGGTALRLYIKARRVSELEPLSDAPQQSDYQIRWNRDQGSEALDVGREPAGRGRLHTGRWASLAGRRIPESIKDWLDDRRSSQWSRRKPQIDPRHFQRVDPKR
jgi:hypothetical protein